MQFIKFPSIENTYNNRELTWAIENVSSDAESVSLASVGDVPNTIKEAIEDKLVTEIEMGNNAMTFKLTKDFIFKGIKFTGEPQDETDPVHELTTQLLELRQAHSDLLKLFNSEN